MRYRVTHRTEYVYESVVSSSFGEAHLAPRELPHQRCGPAQIRITPEPLTVDEMSKLWSSFQKEYRMSTAYQASVVLIESDRRARAPLPVLTRVRLGRHELVFEAEKRQARYSVHVATPSHASVRAEILPDGPRAHPADDGPSPAVLKPLYGLGAGILVAALVAAGIVVGLLKVTGLGKRIQAAPPPPRVVPSRSGQ